MSVDYVGKTRKFIDDSKDEVRRLEREIDRIREIVVRLERYLDETAQPGTIRSEVPRTPSPPPFFWTPEKAEIPSPVPAVPPEPSIMKKEEAMQRTEKVDESRKGRIAGSILRPVGEVAEEILKERTEGMSLDELYRIMLGRTDIPSSRDLKNAIRVSLIRRKPQVVSPRRGWFCWVSAGE